MFDKWQLKRNPFYTRPIEKTSIQDFSGRVREIQELKTFSRVGEGVIMIIGDPGVGTTSLANYARFSNPNSYTLRYEVRMENMKTGTDVLKSLLYSLAQEITKGKFRSKMAKVILKNFVPDQKSLTFSVKALGVGFNISDGKGLLSNPTAIYDVFCELVQDVLKGSKKKFLIFQLNNMNIYPPESQFRLHEILDQLRDPFQTEKTLWYLLGDGGLEKLIKEKIPRVSSIVKNWIHLNPVTSEDFQKIYKKRIQNSGPHAMSPFTEKGVNKLCSSARGRIRFALDVAGSLIQKYADLPFPEILDVPLIEKEAEEKIGAIAARENFTPKTKEILQFIGDHPGVNSTDLSKGVVINGGNLSKFINPLIQNKLVEKVVEGRKVKHYPVGLAKLLKKEK